jgi:hypothetical protein
MFVAALQMYISPTSRAHPSQYHLLVFDVIYVPVTHPMVHDVMTDESAASRSIADVVIQEEGDFFQSNSVDFNDNIIN